MDSVQITVGIPTYNRSAWLAQTMRSVLTQSITSFQVIVSDNASTDDTEDVVRSFGDPRIRYVRSDHNIGRIRNINRLIELAETEFLVLLPDDDVLYPDHLATTVELLQRAESAGLVHTAFDLIDADSRTVRRVRPQRSQFPEFVERGDRVLERMMVSSWPIGFSSVAYRTEAIVAAGGLREDEEPFCDFQMWMRIALDWEFGYVDRPLAGFRVHAEQASARLEGESEAASGNDELALTQAQTRFRRRTDFLDGAPLDPVTTRWLHALATAEFLVERAGLGMAWSELAPSLNKLVRRQPRILVRSVLWRLLLVQLGWWNLLWMCREVTSLHHRVASATLVRFNRPRTRPC